MAETISAHRNDTKNELILAWAGVLFIALMAVGVFAMARFVPPPSPAASAQQIAEMYRERGLLLRAGLLVAMLGCVLWAPFCVAVSAQLRRIEGGSAPMSWLQAVLGAIGVVTILMPLFSMQTAGFRTDRDPQLVLLANDMGWLPFIGQYMTFVPQLLIITYLIFQNPEQRIFPRWYAYLNLWIALSMFGSSLIYVLKEGPFAWNGLFAFYLPLGIFGGWIVVTFRLIRRAIIAGEQSHG